MQVTCQETNNTSQRLTLKEEPVLTGRISQTQVDTVSLMGKPRCLPLELEKYGSRPELISSRKEERRKNMGRGERKNCPEFILKTP